MYGEDDRRLHSWRVLLLPYIEQQELYEEFRLDEPWNSEHNLGLLDRMPSLYDVLWTRHVDPAPYHTVYHVLVGQKTPFEEGTKLQLSDDFPDGLSNTLLFVEAGVPVPWTKPEEIPFDSRQDVKLSGLFRDGFRACTADGRYRFVRHDTDPAVVNAAITRNGGESLRPDW